MKRISRRRFLASGLLFAGSAYLLSACAQPASAPAASGGAPAAEKAAAPTQAAAAPAVSSVGATDGAEALPRGHIDWKQASGESITLLVLPNFVTSLAAMAMNPIFEKLTGSRSPTSHAAPRAASEARAGPLHQSRAIRHHLDDPTTCRSTARTNGRGPRQVYRRPQAHRQAVVQRRGHLPELA